MNNSIKPSFVTTLEWITFSGHESISDGLRFVADWLEQEDRHKTYDENHISISYDDDSDTFQLSIQGKAAIGKTIAELRDAGA